VIAFAARGAEVTSGRDRGAASAGAERALDDGSALERFRLMVEAQGGDPRVVDDPAGTLPVAPVVVPIEAARAGTITAIAAEEIGLASGALGAGRMHKGDAIDPAVGIVVHCKIGDRIEAGQPIGSVHARSHGDARDARQRVLGALSLGEDPVSAPALVHTWLE
jgi:thymidine phosphorylase